jgi:flagellar motor switch protein FliG
MISATGNAYQAGIRKAAILVASLDEYAADLLLEQLGPERAQLVREAVMALDEIDHQEQQRVIDEFRRIGPLLPGKCPSGIELDGPLALQLASAGARESSEDEPADGEPARPFGFLHEAEEEKLAELLCSERPQTIALVLSHLPAERAGDVLARFAPTLQVEVVRRLVELENSDPETLRDVERALEARLSQQFAIERKRAAGPAAVA